MTACPWAHYDSFVIIIDIVLIEPDKLYIEHFNVFRVQFETGVFTINSKHSFIILQYSLELLIPNSK